MRAALLHPRQVARKMPLGTATFCGTRSKNTGLNGSSNLDLTTWSELESHWRTPASHLPASSVDKVRDPQNHNPSLPKHS